MDHATTVENAVKRFYANADNDAHTWLIQAQASPEAWTFVWQLLDPSKSGEVQFFAATTLQAKIHKQWAEVPKSEYLALQARILEVLKSPGTSKIVLSKLCQALATFMFNCHNSQPENKDKGVVEKLMEILPYNSSATVKLLVEVLEVLTKDFARQEREQQDVRLLKSLAARQSVVNEWVKASWNLQQILSSCGQAADSESKALYFSSIKCALAWMKLGLPLDTLEQIYPHLLIAAAHYLPKREEMEAENNRDWEAVQECLTMVVTHTELYGGHHLFWDWAKSLICMVQTHGAKHYYEILTAFGEAHSHTLLLGLVNTDPNKEQQNWTAKQLIEFLLECSEQEGRYPVDEKRSCIPFGFWYALQDDVYALDEPIDKQAHLAIKPIYARVAQALLRKATLPSSPSEAGSDDERELLRCYRQDAADTLIYCYYVLREDLLILLGQRLSQTYEDASKWTEVESTIHAFKALSDNASEHESHYVAAIMDVMLSHVPYGIYPREVLCCACSAIGEYALWIGQHPDPWLERSLQLVVMGLTHGPLTAPAASMALKDIARECAEHMAPLAPSILEAIGRTLPNVTPGEGLRLMYAAGKLLNLLATPEEQLSHLEITLGLCVMRLRQLLQMPVKEAQDAVVDQFKMITTFFTTLEGSIGNVVLEALLPSFQGIINHPEWSRNDKTLEAMHTCAQKSLPSLLHPEQETKPLISILRTSYRTHPHPAALTFLRQLILLFRNDPENVIGPLFSEISELTLGGFQACCQVNGNMADLSELLQVYLGLLSQICRKSSRLLLQNPDQVPSMLQCGMACLLLQDNSTLKAAGTFLSNAITQCPHLQTFIHPVGQELVCIILRCIVGAVPRNSLEPHAEVLFALSRSCPRWTIQWLRLALEDSSAPDVSQAEKEKFTKDVLRQNRKLQVYLKMAEFSLLCRQNALGGL